MFEVLSSVLVAVKILAIAMIFLGAVVIIFSAMLSDRFSRGMSFDAKNGLVDALVFFVIFLIGIGFVMVLVAGFGEWEVLLFSVVAVFFGMFRLSRLQVTNSSDST